jgi:hypothetical protein
MANTISKQEDKVKELFESKFKLPWQDDYMIDIERYLYVCEDKGYCYSYKGTPFAFIGALNLCSGDRTVNTTFDFKEL